MSGKRYFVTGTDTGVGKTLVSAALLHLAKQKKLQALGLKPLAAGCENTPDGLRNEDALMLQHWSSVDLDYAQINPVALKDPIAPHIAAAREQRRLSAERLVGFCRGALTRSVEFGLIEGAGGWRVPLNRREFLSDVPKVLGLPVVLIVGVRLGCLNHAILTAEAIVRDGLSPVAWVANIIDAEMAACDENIDTLTSLFPFPRLGTVPFLLSPSPSSAAAYLDIGALI